MCGGARYIDKTGKDWKIYFPNPKAALPVQREGNEIEWVKWGVRSEEQNVFHGFVSGGWARIDSIEAGKWDRCRPERVKLAVIAFMEKGANRVSHWIDVPKGTAIDALIVTIEDERRLYIVTENTPLFFSWIHDRWPRLISTITDEPLRAGFWDEYEPSSEDE
jgi:hypothetical protein